MGVYIEKPEKEDIAIRVTEDQGEVCLSYRDHTFAVCRTNAAGDHVIEIHDIDAGLLKEYRIGILCWSR
jgi:hypothetical protein